MAAEVAVRPSTTSASAMCDVSDDSADDHSAGGSSPPQTPTSHAARATSTLRCSRPAPAACPPSFCAHQDNKLLVTFCTKAGHMAMCRSYIWNREGQAAPPLYLRVRRIG